LLVPDSQGPRFIGTPTPLLVMRVAVLAVIGAIVLLVVVSTTAVLVVPLAVLLAGLVAVDPRDHLASSPSLVWLPLGTRAAGDITCSLAPYAPKGR